MLRRKYFEINNYRCIENAAELVITTAALKTCSAAFAMLRKTKYSRTCYAAFAMLRKTKYLLKLLKFIFNSSKSSVRSLLLHLDCEYIGMKYYNRSIANAAELIIMTAALQMQRSTAEENGDQTSIVHKL